MSTQVSEISRRDFCRRSAAGLASVLAAGAAPVIVPARVLGAEAPSKKLALGVIGCGRIAHTFNVPSCLANGGKAYCDFIALSDVDLARLRSLRNRLAGAKMQGRDLVAMPLEEAQRTSTACVLGYMAMKLGRKLKWDAKAERFIDDAEANGMMFRPAREGFGVRQYLAELSRS